MSNFRLKASLFVLGAALVVSLAVSTHAAEVVIRAQTSMPTQHDLSQSFLDLYVAKVNDVGKGIVQIKYLGGPEVTPQNKAAQALQRGVFDLLHTPAAYHAGITPESSALMATNKSQDEVRANGGFDLMTKIWREKLNAKIVAWSETAAQFYLYTVKEPVIKDGALDLTGFKIRTTGAYRSLVEALNGTSVNMAVSDVNTGLQRGVIDGFGWPTVGLKSMGLHEEAKYRIDPPFYHLANLVLVNQDFWGKMPKEAQDVLLKVGAEYEKASSQRMMEQARVDEDALNAKGVKIFKLEGAARKKYLKAAYDAMWARVAQKLSAGEVELLKSKLYAEE
jgi:TRAP-type C4-dicarboxylate transport system substrate-binding protein